VSRPEREAARAFQRFLAEEVDAELAGSFGFRPADLDEPPAGRVTKENGADPAQPERVLGLPDPRVLNRIKRTWRMDRKPANILLVVDTSGSMNDQNRLPRAKEGLETFFREVSPSDRVGLTTFSDVIQPLVPIEPFAQNEGRLRETVANLIADGGTAFFDATVEGLRAVEGLNDEQRINAVVLLTDGEDTDSSLAVDQVVSRLRAQGESATRVRVFTIAYSAEAEGAEEALDAIAKASGGQPYAGDTEDIETVYRSISSFF
jgi:Ca-activated chloride channel family protein